MKKIDVREHNYLMDAFERYKRYYKLYGNIKVTKEQDNIIRSQVSELQEIYDYYTTLMDELEKCLKKYRSSKNSLKIKMQPSVRKMNTIHKNRK